MASARFLDPSSIPLKRQSGGNIWATLAQITQALTLVALLCILMLFFLPVINKTHRLQEEKLKLQQDILAKQDEQSQLKLETEQLKNNPTYVEHIARDQLNMGKPGETIIRFDKYQPAASVAPKSSLPASGEIPGN